MFPSPAQSEQLVDSSVATLRCLRKTAASRLGTALFPITQLSVREVLLSFLANMGLDDVQASIVAVVVFVVAVWIAFVDCVASTVSTRMHSVRLCRE